MFGKPVLISSTASMLKVAIRGRDASDGYDLLMLDMHSSITRDSRCFFFSPAFQGVEYPVERHYIRSSLQPVNSVDLARPREFENRRFP